MHRSGVCRTVLLDCHLDPLTVALCKEIRAARANGIRQPLLQDKPVAGVGQGTAQICLRWQLGRLDRPAVPVTPNQPRGLPDGAQRIVSASSRCHAGDRIAGDATTSKGAIAALYEFVRHAALGAPGQ